MAAASDPVGTGLYKSFNLSLRLGARCARQHPIYLLAPSCTL